MANPPTPDISPQVKVDSPALQAHVATLQGIIARLAGNSAACKNWCVTLVAAIVVIVADKGKPEFTLFALLPVIMFALIDGYYLMLEKQFRDAHELLVTKLHSADPNEWLKESDLYNVKPVINKWAQTKHAATSFSVWGFYGPLLLLVGGVWCLTSGTAGQVLTAITC